MRTYFSLCAIAVIVLLGGCANSRPPEGPDNPSCELHQFVRNDVYSDLGIYMTKARSVAASARPPVVNVLTLSAGGEFGAYGAGVLIGWGSVGEQAQPSPRRDIQIVTGLSTGAILATHAFLGKDLEIERAYLGSSGESIYRERFEIELLWSNSLLDASGKAKLIEQYLTRTEINAVAEGSDGRGLHVGIVDADSGDFQRIDMVALAKPEVRRRAGLHTDREPVGGGLYESTTYDIGSWRGPEPCIPARLVLPGRGQ